MTTPDPYDAGPEIGPQPDVTPNAPNPDSSKTTAATSWVQLLLDPRSLQTLMLAGGGLLALGLVLWLAVIGVFDEPIYGALGLGVANFGLLGAGVWLAAKTRYRLAGRATAMLACLLLPLNLWFYDAQGLITLADGGHLWLPALMCCVVYAGVARLLKDSLFVYAITGGVAMTGLVFLADGDVGRFWEVLAPSTLLVSLGVACLHVERLFPFAVENEENVAFTRDDFGRAFFRAGHALMASGLVVLLGGRLAGRLYETLFADLGWFVRPDVATETTVQLAALGLALAGVYGYAYSRFVVGGRRYTLAAVLSLAWSAVIGIDLLGIDFTETMFVGVLAGIGIACQLVREALPASEEKDTDMAGLLASFGRVAGIGALVLALGQLVRGVWLQSEPWLGYEFGMDYLVVAALTAAAQGLAARGGTTDDRPNRLLGPALATLVLVGGAAFTAPFALTPATVVLALAMVPLAWALIGCIAKPQQAARAAEATGFLVLLLLAPFVAFEATLTTIAATAALAAACGLIAIHANRRYAAVLAALLVIATGGQAIGVYELGARLPLLLLSVVGLVAMAVDRCGVRGHFGVAGRIAVVLAALAGGLLAGNRLLAGEADWSLAGMVVVQAVIGVAAAMMTRTHEGRYGLIAVTVLQLVVAGLTVNAISVLNFPQRLELLSVAVGTGLLVIGHLGWRRETADGQTETRETFVDANLWFGSLLATVPLTLGLLFTRGAGGDAWWIMLHEVGVLAIGLTLVGSGVLCRLRATTLAGVGALTVYLVSLIALVNLPDQLQNVAVYLMAGGGVLFGGAVLLSVYRDRILAIPDRIRDGQGVFAVLKWR